jgi:hypothetical protein
MNFYQKINVLSYKNPPKAHSLYTIVKLYDIIFKVKISKSILKTINK